MELFTPVSFVCVLALGFWAFLKLSRLLRRSYYDVDLRKMIELIRMHMDPSTVKDLLRALIGENRTSLYGERLSMFEIHWMMWRVEKGFPGCVDCEKGDLRPGPTGGLCINIYCTNPKCGSKFNVVNLDKIDRISDSSPRKMREMVNFGPHR